MSKSVSTSVNLSPKESRLLTLKAELAHESRSEFIRRRLIFGKVPRIVYPSDKQYLHIFTQLASSARSMSSLASSLRKQQRITERLLLVSDKGFKKSKPDFRKQLKKSDSFIKNTVTPELHTLADRFITLDRYIRRQLRR